jgi:hypothetical protein
LFHFVSATLDEFHHDVPGQEQVFFFVEGVKPSHRWRILAQQVNHHVAI